MWGISAGLNLGGRVSKRFLASFTQSKGCSQSVLQRVVHALHLQVVIGVLVVGEFLSVAHS